METQRIRLRLNSPVAAVKIVQPGSEDGIFVNLPTGTLTAVLGPSSSRYGMTEIYSKGNYYLVFEKDLSERADPLFSNPLPNSTH